MSFFDNPVWLDAGLRRQLADPWTHATALEIGARRLLEGDDPHGAFMLADRRCRIGRVEADHYVMRADALRRLGEEARERADIASALELDPTHAGALARLETNPEFASARGADEARHRQGMPTAAAPPVHASHGQDLDAVLAVAGSRTLSIIIPVYDDLPAISLAIQSALRQRVPDTEVRVIVVEDCTPSVEIAAYLQGIAGPGAIDLIRNPSNLGFAASVNRALEFAPHGDVLLLNADAYLPPGAAAELAAAARREPDVGTVTPLSNNGEYTSFPAAWSANPLPSPREIDELDATARDVNAGQTVTLPVGIGFCLYITSTCRGAVGQMSEAYGRGYLEDADYCLRAREHGFRNICAGSVFVGHAGGRSFQSSRRALVVRNAKRLERRFPGYPAESAAFVQADPIAGLRAALERARPPRGPCDIIVSGRAAQAHAVADLAAKRTGAAPMVLVAEWTSTATGMEATLKNSAEGGPCSLRFSLDRDGCRSLRAYLEALDVRRLIVSDPVACPDALLGELLDRCGTFDLLIGDAETIAPGYIPAEGQVCPAEAGTPCRPCGRGFVAKAAGASVAFGDWRERWIALAPRIGTLVAADRLARAFAESYLAPHVDAEIENAFLPDAIEVASARPAAKIVGLYAPLPNALVDRFSLALADAFAAALPEFGLVVFGTALDELALIAAGRIFVTGQADDAAVAAMVRMLRPAAFCLPYRTALFGPFDAIASRSGAARAYFDWSFGKAAKRPGDLAMDPRLCNATSAATVAAWCASLAVE